MFRIVGFAVVTLVSGVIAVRYMDEIGRAPAASAVVKVHPVPAPANPSAMVIKAGFGGQFEIEARVDGRRVAFIVDTGASQIALRASDGARLGFNPSPHDYSIRMMTANGEGRAALVALNRVEVGDIVVRDLPALIIPDEMLRVNLLGMSFLSRLRWSHDRGNLILQQ